MTSRRVSFRRFSMVQKIATVLVGGVVLAAQNAIPGVIGSAAADECPEVEVIFARGTSEPPGIGVVGQAFVDSLHQQTGKNIGVYAVNYAASRLQLHGGDGAKDAISHIEAMANQCPATPLVLGGYSQGADVIDIVSGVPFGGISFGSPLPAQYAANVAAVAVFGNPSNRAGGSLPSLSPLFGSKAIDLCNSGDPICHAGPGNDWNDHTDGYVPAYTTAAATFVATRLLAGSGLHMPGSPSQLLAPGVQLH